MISLSHLNKLIILIFSFVVVVLNSSLSEEEPVDIWKEKEKQNDQNVQIDEKNSTGIESPILSEDKNKIVVEIDENELGENDETVVGIFDPEENNFNLNMWLKTDGEEIKKVMSRISKLKLSEHSENLLFQVLFTNAYSPKKNLNEEEFLKIKIDWLINRERIEDLEILLKTNPKVGENSKVIKLLINEYLSSANIKSACEKINFIDRRVQDNYLDKFKIYCLINDERKEEASLVFDLLKERGFKDKFFEDKINFLFGISEKTNQKILDDNLLNFYFSHITAENFEYEPNEKTDKYIWKYLSSANLIEVNNIENENIILTYEKAAVNNSFDKDEIFKIYLKMNFNFNQLLNAEEIYKNLPNYKARALIYQSVMLTDNIEKKINLALLLKDLFINDKLFNIYAGELSNILKSIDPNEIPKDYTELVEQNFDEELSKKVKFDNGILHRSKVIRHFLEDDKKLNRTEKDFKSVYKKIKRNKKYFISIKDIIVLESLAADGITLPEDLDYNELSLQLTVPQNLQDLVNQKQIGLVMLKIVEIIGEDNITDLDPETVYFLSRILNELNLKKIRNNILSEALPIRV
tara:strand:- start:1567 stop:3306 length:1740 start_codon:yes stop_codon:yes gene_type:complete